MVQLLIFHFDSYSYFDLNFATNLDNDLDIIFGINNILDDDPPINGYIGYVPGNANTFPAFYDSLGRFIYLKISKKIKLRMNVCFIDIGGTNIRYSFFYNNKRLSIKKKEIPVSKSFNQILNEILKEKIQLLLI